MAAAAVSSMSLVRRGPVQAGTVVERPVPAFIPPNLSAKILASYEQAAKNGAEASSKVGRTTSDREVSSSWLEGEDARIAASLKVQTEKLLSNSQAQRQGVAAPSREVEDLTELAKVALQRNSNAIAHGIRQEKSEASKQKSLKSKL